MDLKVQSGLKADKRDLTSFKGFLQKHFKKYIGQNQQSHLQAQVNSMDEHAWKILKKSKSDNFNTTNYQKFNLGNNIMRAPKT